MKKIVLFLFSLAIVLFSCKDKPKETTTNKKEEETSVVTLTPQQLEKAALQVSAVETKSINSRLQVNGMVDVPPQSMVSVSFPLGGYLKSTKLLPGLEVNKGEVLAVLEDPQFIQLQQDYLMAKSKLAYAEADYNRQKELSTSQAVSEKNLQMAKTEYESQKILVKALEQKLALININPAKLSENNITRSINVYSPIHGFVSKVNVNIGKYVSPTDVLFELVDPSDIHLNLTVFEKDAALLGIGQKVIAYNNNKPDEKHLAEIFLISRNVNEDRAVSVHCHFEDYDKKLLPGMYMNAIIEVKNTEAKAVPDDAIVRWQSKFYVFVAKGNNQFEMTEVLPGGSADGYTAITLAGNKSIDGLQIVTKNAYTLLMKLKNSAEEE